LNDDDVPTDIEAWGFQKNVYMFKDLERYFLAKGKGGKEGQEERERWKEAKSPKQEEEG